MLVDAEFGGGARMHLGPAVPDYLISRLWNLLQPGLVCAAAIVEKNVRESGKCQTLRRGHWWRCLAFQDGRVEPNFGSLSLCEEAPLPARLVPKLIGVRV